MRQQKSCASPALRPVALALVAAGCGGGGEQEQRAGRGHRSCTARRAATSRALDGDVDYLDPGAAYYQFTTRSRT